MDGFKIITQAEKWMLFRGTQQEGLLQEPFGKFYVALRAGEQKLKMHAIAGVTGRWLNSPGKIAGRSTRAAEPTV